MQPLMQEQFLDKVSALRIGYGGASKDIPIQDLRENSIVTIPKNEKVLALRLVFADGTLGANKKFELAHPEPDASAPPDPAAPQETPK